MDNTQKAIEEIKNVSDGASADPADLVMYSLDATGIRHKPDIVVFPESTEEVAELLHCAVDTVRRVPGADLPYSRVGRKNLYLLPDVEVLIRKRRIGRRRATVRRYRQTAPG